MQLERTVLRSSLLIAGVVAGIALVAACAEKTADDSGSATAEEPIDHAVDVPPPEGDPGAANNGDPNKSVVVISQNPPSAPPEEEEDPPSDAGAPSTDASPPAVDAGKDAGKDSGTDSGTSSSSSSSSSSSTSSSSSSSSSGGTPGACSVTRTGGGGNDPSGVIPVCCAPTAAQKTQLNDLFNQLNAYRASKGKPALTYDVKLEAAVQGHCQHMGAHGFFDHYAPETVVKNPWDRAKLCATTAVSENLAGGQSSPTAVMTSWKNSAGHDANMLGNFKRVGLCRSGSYWGQLFGN